MKNILLKFSNQVLSKGQLKAIRGGYGGCEPMNEYFCSFLLNGTSTPVTGTGCGVDAQDATQRCISGKVAAGFDEDEFICSCN